MYEHLDTTDLNSSAALDMTAQAKKFETVLCLKARQIARTLGIKVAAGYLRNRGAPISVALYWLTGSTRELHG